MSLKNAELLSQIGSFAEQKNVDRWVSTLSITAMVHSSCIKSLGNVIKKHGLIRLTLSFDYFIYRIIKNVVLNEGLSMNQFIDSLIIILS